MVHTHAFEEKMQLPLTFAELPKLASNWAHVLAEAGTPRA
jgi:hypothetical protein